MYFDESLYPWRPKGDQRIGTPTPTAAPPSDENDVTSGGASADVGAKPKPKPDPVETYSTLPEAFAGATQAAKARVNKSITLLIMALAHYIKQN